MVNPLDLTGRTVLVTGASSGIGRDTAVLLSQLNARVILTGRNAERLEQTRSALAGDGHRAVPFDLSQTGEIPKWMESITTESGPFDALVHAAGKQTAMPIRFASEQRIDDLIRTNFYSSVMLARGFSQKGCHAKEGSIVFVSSVMAFTGRPAISVYGATKGALTAFVKSLALELAPERVRVNCLAPGFVQTEMLDQLREVATEEQMQALEHAHPLGFGTPRDVAYAAAFLLADTGRWITGTTLVLDGGYSAQ
jgi:NAD(P)-dependent dehydrogenase (short-subunit alcohol dehydrogenase family)